MALYLAYHITLNRSIENIKTLVHHSHNLEETRNFLNDFGRSKLLVTVRDPRANLKSGIVNWIKYDNARDNQEHFYLYIKRIREDLKFARKQNNQIFFIKLEEANDINLKKKLTKFLNVEFHPAMNVATYAGKKWIGDKLSQHNSQDGSYDKTVRNNQWEDFFSKKDKLVLNFIYKDYQIFGYKINTSGWFDKILIFFTIPLPFSFDKNFFKIKKKYIFKFIFLFKKNYLSLLSIFSTQITLIMNKKIEIFCTLGPSTLNKNFLKFSNKKISLLRLNMSHIEINKLKKTINFVKKIFQGSYMH